MPAPDLQVPSTIVELVRLRALSHSDEVAFRTPVCTWTFAQIDTASNRMAQGLKALGIGPGDRIGCYTKHSVECVVALAAAAKLGAVCAIFNWRLTAHELQYVVQQSKARILVTDQALLSQVQSLDVPQLLKILVLDADDNAASLRPSLQTPLKQWRDSFAAIDTDYVPDSEDTVLQLNSSGTTGLPKAVEISHRSVLGQCRLLHVMVGYGQLDRFVMLNALPNFHVSGMVNMMSTLYEGGTTVCYPEFVPAMVIQGLQEHRITHTFVVPAMLQFLLNAPGVEQGDYSSLKGIMYGGSPIAESLLHKVMHVFKCDLYQVYGMTEVAGALTFLMPADHAPESERAHLLQSAGRPAPGFAIRIVDPMTGATMPDNATGEVWVSGPTLMNGYFNNPEATAAAFPIGRTGAEPWYRSGDAGCMRDGYLYIQDRIKDMIISGGENIYPAEIENVLALHTAIAEVAVIGVPDDKWGEAVKALVVLRPDQIVSSDELIHFCRTRLAGYKCPKSIEFVTSLPRSTSGKLLKRILREPYWSGRERLIG